MSTEPISALVASAKPSASGRPRRLGPRILIPAIFLALMVVAAVLAPLIAPYDPTATDVTAGLQQPSTSHWLGTDLLGRDLLSRLVYGARISLTGTLQAVLTVLVIGVPIGLVAGYFGGWLDRVCGWFIDVLLAVPGIIMLLVVLAVVGNNETVAMVSLGILGAPGMARVVRGATLSVREELYITAASVSGLGPGRIIVNHVVPRVTGPIIVRASLFAGTALLVETGLGYLGFGAQPPNPSWGNMVADASTVIASSWWPLIPTGLAIALSILSFGLLGDALRDSSADKVSGPRRQPRVAKAATAVPVAVAAPVDDGPPPDALLVVRDLSITVPDASGGADAPVVSKLSIHIRAGETVGLVGESGCGKSMTGRALLRLLPEGASIAGGEMMYDGQDVLAMSKRELRSLRGSEIAFISQEPIASLDPVFTVGSQLFEILRRDTTRSKRACRAHAVDLLSQVNLRDPERVLRSYPHQLSGGMAQRVAIAMALAGQPKFLIADEPTTALDVTVQADILALLRRIQRDTGMAVLLISHDWGVVADICDRAYVMYAGEVVEEAAVEALFDQPLHPYSSGLLSCAPGRGTRGEPLPAISGRVPRPGAWPVGCHFSPRCPLATEECTGEAIPMTVSPSAGRSVRCVHSAHVTEGIFAADGRS